MSYLTSNLRSVYDYDYDSIPFTIHAYDLDDLLFVALLFLSSQCLFFYFLHLLLIADVCISFLPMSFARICLTWIVHYFLHHIDFMIPIFLFYLAYILEMLDSCIKVYAYCHLKVPAHQ